MFAAALMQTVSSDSLGLNMVLVLLELCLPFLKVGDERLKRVDISYLYSKLRYDVSHETAICYSKARVTASRVKKIIGRTRCRGGKGAERIRYNN